MNRDLLKEAIADAKAVKETAIANAKAALEEQFAPFLKEKLAAKLAEMDEMDEAEEMDEAKQEVDEVEDMDEAKEMDEAKDEMSEGEDMEEAKDMDEMDLDELLAELDAELNEAEDMDEGKKEMDEALDTINDPDTPTAKGNMAEAEEDGEGEEGEDEEIDLEDMSEDDLKKFIEDVIEDMVAAGELEAGESFEDDVDVDVDGEGELEIEDDEQTAVDEAKDMDEGYDVDEAKKEMDESLMDKLKAVYNDPEVLGKLITVDGKKMSLKDFLAMAGGATAGSMAGGGQRSSTKTPGSGVAEADMEEMMAEIEELKSELNEVNLLNSKLLYVNKIFRSRTLTENQKAKVLGAFDKASTVAEVKLVFETLNEGLTPKKAAMNENLGRASKPMGNAPTKKPILEVNDQYARWQKLAGIK